MLHDLDVEMSRRQKAEDALRVADRRKDEFLATLAHELRNPLAPLVTGLEVLKNPAADPQAQSRARDLMIRQLKQMVRLIDDLLDVSRITTNKLQLRRDDLDLKAIVREAIEVAEPSLRERGHRLKTAWPAAAVHVAGDATRLTQVVVNLLNNAIKYTAPGGRIAVAIETTAEEAAVHVRDNGIGIDAAEQASIFEMFMQVDKSLERERAGLGVGLSLARHLVELHGGRIAVQSAGRGPGSTFTVTLPRVAAPAESPDEPAAPAPSIAEPRASAMPAQSGRLRILVADDNVDLATSLGDLLETLGHSVRNVHDGREAFAAATADPPDIALFDIGMPVLNGYDLAQRLRADPATRDLPMVAITGWGQDADRERARRAGFDRHLVKPVDPAELSELLRSFGERATGGILARDR
jgi:CheY-like chemotaxis protein